VPEIIRLFHGSQIVHDVLEVGRLYHDFFGSWVYEAQYLQAEEARNASHLLGGTFSIEMLAPVHPDGDSGVARFLRRHGPHLNNVAFWARDCRALAQQLLDRGVRVAVRGGGFADRLPDGDFDYVITHPKDTHGLVLEFLEDQPIHDPRHRSWWDASFWSDHHPLGVVGLSHFTVVVADLDAAANVFARALGCEGVGAPDDAALDARRACFAIGDTVAELAEPTSPESAIGRHLAAHGPILYAFTFTVRDLEQVRRHAHDYGIDLVEYGDNTVALDPARTFGAVFGFTEQRAGTAR
jgi:catechol 2,3-dioxygenase-like lactoylglutathione lyase family enzyme